jgi:multidrug efflux system membrane fusion protein
VVIKRTQGGESVIGSGLEGGESVVTDGQLRLVNGAAVAARPAQGEPAAPAPAPPAPAPPAPAPPRG